VCESNRLLKQEAGVTAREVVGARITTNIQTTYEDAADARYDQGRQNEAGVTPVVKCFSKSRSKDRGFSL
jgi:hypothetical protein